MTDTARKVEGLIEATIEQKQGKGFRNHLGASIIGRECPRQIWYIFRWAKQSRVKARILRLFDRGNEEEHRFLRYIRGAGIVALELDPATGKQFRISDHEGHFGGSLDAILRFVPGWPDEDLLAEFKTHGDKSFQELKKKGLRAAKREHYVQMQIYMHKRKLKAGLYFAVNKNDDEWFVDLVLYDEATAQQYLDRALKIIQINEPPIRISESPNYFACNWCDYQQICQYGAPAAFNCRTCQHVRPVAGGGEEGVWHCTCYDVNLTEAQQKMGCQSRLPIIMS